MYDDWEYASKDGCAVPSLTYMPANVVWQYADPDKKTHKAKNRRLQFHLDLIQSDLIGRSSKLTGAEVKDLLLKHVAAGSVELGTPAGWNNLCWGVAELHRAQVLHGTQLVLPDGDIADPDTEDEMSD